MYFDSIASANGVWVGVSLIALVLTFQYIYLPTLVDGFRDRLFHERRRLFVLVARAELSTLDPAYLSLREALNSFIRYAERVTFLRGLAMPVAFTYFLANERERKDLQRAMPRANAITKVSNPAVREQLKEIENAMAKAVAIHVFASSPFAWFTILFAIPLMLIGAAVAGSIGGVGKSTDKFVSEISERAECEMAILNAA